MLVLLIGEGKMHKLILPQVPSGSFVINDKIENNNVQLLEIESRDGKWQIISDNNARVLNHKYLDITNDYIQIVNQNPFINGAILEEYKVYELIIGDSQELYFLFCLPAYESKWIKLDIKNTQEITIGSNKNNHICYTNELVSDVHARLFLNNGRWMIENFDKKCGTFLNNYLLYKSSFVFNGDIIFIMGLKIILMGNSIYINKPLGKMIYNVENLIKDESKNTQKIIKDEEDNQYIELYSPKDYFYSSPRIIKKMDIDEIKIEPPPTKKENDGMPAFLTVGTTLSMGLMSVITLISTFSDIFSGNATLGNSMLSIISSLAMLVCMLLIPLLTTQWEKQRDKKYEAKRQKKYREYMDKMRVEINEIKKKKKQLLFENYATTEECTQIILNKSKRLWERTIQDPDFLRINLGIGDIPLGIPISYPEKEAFSMGEEDNLKDMVDKFTEEIETLKDAPVTISLANEKITAYIDKDEENIDRFMQNLFIQLMAFQNYNDLKLVFLLKEDKLKKWEYVKMFPYVWENSKDFRFFEDDVNHMDEISKYLEDEFNKRIEDNNQDIKYDEFETYYLIITDDYRKVENLNIVTKLLQTNTNIGFSILCIANDIKQLPKECKTFISLDGNSGQVFSNELSSKTKIDFRFNNLDTFFFENIRKVISNIPIKHKLTEKNSLPTNYSFLEMYKVGLIEQLNIEERWKSNDTTLSLAAPIGVRPSGKLINLDIHEKIHGPHGLIAGSTGSGKSEFIITYILSLAINYHPYDVNFILIDYKGGGLAKVFEKEGAVLPHLAGTITNIDTDSLKRSLVSIQSELKRRQVLFNEAREMTDGGVIDIYKYQKLYHSGILQKPIPHLLIICDEFAELKQQQPDFMDELVSVARIGRSLGVHLILATQKPSGIVDDQIRSNSKFAICLKVQDKSDSIDVIERPEAAFLKQSGRFYIKVGNDDYFDIGQSGWSGAQYYPSDTTSTKEDDSIRFISNIGAVTKEANDYSKKQVEGKGDQLINILKEMNNVAQKQNILTEKIWLEDIPEKIYVKDIKEKYKVKKKANNIAVTIGEYDDPENQRQGIVNFDLIKNGNIIIYGNAESGKETLMSTIVYDLMTTYTTNDVWMYILDFGTESLKIFNECPHVGEVIFSRDNEKLTRFFSRIKEMVKERKEILSDYNGDYNFYIKTSGNTMPLITILINGYESLIERYDDVFDDTLLTLTREGIKTGIVFILTTAGTNDLRYRMTQNFKQKIALSLTETSEYTNVFEGIGSKKPANRFGRGLVNIGEGVYEFQTAKSCEPEEYNVFIKEEIERVKKMNTLIAERIQILPDVVKKEKLDVPINDLENVPIGLRKKDIRPELYDFRNNIITIITSKNIEEASQFTSNIWQLIEAINNVEVIILDPNRKLLSGRNDLAENYKKLIDEKENKKSKFNVCIILGVDKFIDYIEESAKESQNDGEDEEDDYSSDYVDGAEKLANIISDCEKKKNFSFIIVDTADRIKEHNYDDWYKDNVLETNVIWVGNGIDNQYILEVNAPRKDVIDNCGCSFGYINKKDRTILLKLLEMKEKREEDE